MGGDIAFAVGASWASAVAGGAFGTVIGGPAGTFIGAAAGLFAGLGSSIGYILANDNRTPSSGPKGGAGIGVTSSIDEDRLRKTD